MESRLENMEAVTQCNIKWRLSEVEESYYGEKRGNNGRLTVRAAGTSRCEETELAEMKFV